MDTAAPPANRPPPSPSTADLTVFLPADAVDDAGNPVFETDARGRAFYPAPEARFGHLPMPTQAVLAGIRRVLPAPRFQTFVLRTDHGRRLWHGRRVGNPDGPRIPGMTFAAFVLDGLLRRRTDLFEQLLRNLNRHVGDAMHALDRWHRNLEHFAERYLPGHDFHRPQRDPDAVPQTVGLSSAYEPLLFLGHAIATYDDALRKSTAVNRLLRPGHDWNVYHAAHYEHFRALRAILYAVQATRKIGLPLPEDARIPFTLLDRTTPPPPPRED